MKRKNTSIRKIKKILKIITETAGATNKSLCKDLQTGISTISAQTKHLQTLKLVNIDKWGNVKHLITANDRWKYSTMRNSSHFYTLTSKGVIAHKGFCLLEKAGLMNN